jgi:predicted lipoprotein with Yx(FWY)xxD motif
MVYSHINKKNGTTYYLHKKGHLFYFSKDKTDGIDLPDGYKVIENSRTGLPMLKKK